MTTYREDRKFQGDGKHAEDADGDSAALVNGESGTKAVDEVPPAGDPSYQPVTSTEAPSGQDIEIRRSAQVVLTPDPVPDGQPLLESELIGRPQGRLENPESMPQLIYLMWKSLDFRKAAAAAFLVFTVGLALSMVVGVLALALALIGISPLWSVSGGLVATGGAAALVFGYIRRRRGDGPGRSG